MVSESTTEAHPIREGDENRLIDFLMEIGGRTFNEKVTGELRDGQNVLDQPPFSWGLESLGEMAIKESAEHSSQPTETNCWVLFSRLMQKGNIPAIAMYRMARSFNPIEFSQKRNQGRIAGKLADDLKILAEVLTGLPRGGVETLQMVEPLLTHLRPFVIGVESAYLTDVVLNGKHFDIYGWPRLSDEHQKTYAGYKLASEQVAEGAKWGGLDDDRYPSLSQPDLMSPISLPAVGKKKINARRRRFKDGEF